MRLGRYFTRGAAGTLVALLLVMGGVASAASGNGSSASSSTGSSTSKSGGGTVQGYAADSVLQNGTIVQLTGSGAAKVAPATSKNLLQMYGVTVDPHDLSLTISSSNLTNEVYVATNGTYSVLVSTQDGAIKIGDYVTMSAIDGVGMKATTDQKTVFGRAAGSFDGKNNSIGSATLKDTSGQTNKTVALGLIPVAINIQRNPNQKSTEADLPKVLQRIGQAVAEKPVGPLRIYLSIGVTGLCITIALVTLYAGIRNAVISIGRNPLSKKSIFRGLLEIILTSFLILIIGLFTVYLLLKL